MSEFDRFNCCAGKAAVDFDGRVFRFVLLLSTIAALAIGLFPAFKASKPDVVTELKEGGRGSEAGGPIKTEETGEVHGTMLTFLETIFPLRDAVGNMFGVCWIGTEISDIKRAEEALARTAADLKEAQRVAHIGSWIFDVATEKLEWSEELYRIHGLDPSAPPLNFRKDVPKLFTPESMKALQDALEKLEQGRAPYELDLEAILPNGSTRWLSARAEPMIDANGRLVAVRGTSQDITQLKQLQRMKEEWMSVIAHA